MSDMKRATPRWAGLALRTALGAGPVLGLVGVAVTLPETRRGRVAAAAAALAGAAAGMTGVSLAALTSPTRLGTRGEARTGCGHTHKPVMPERVKQAIAEGKIPAVAVCSEDDCTWTSEPGGIEQLEREVNEHVQLHRTLNMLSED